MHLFSHLPKKHPAFLLAGVAQMAMLLWIFGDNRFSKPLLSLGWDRIGLTYLEYYSGEFLLFYHNTPGDRVVGDMYDFLRCGLNFLSAWVFFLSPMIMLCFCKYFPMNLVLRVTMIVSLLYMLEQNYQFSRALFQCRNETAYGTIVAICFSLHYLAILSSYLICFDRSRE
jgi:hypothetical protein